MIDVKDATRIATEHFAELYQGTYQNLAVEEVELSEDEKHWLVTLGFSVQGLQSMTAASTTREHKEIRVATDSGRVVSMRIKRL